MPAMVEALSANGRDRSSLVVAPRVDVSAVGDDTAVAAWRDAGADELICSVNSPNLADHHAGLAHVAALAAAHTG
jgi:hypothetical protein